jgi:hypothetical protein
VRKRDVAVLAVVAFLSGVVAVWVAQDGLGLAGKGALARSLGRAILNAILQGL